MSLDPFTIGLILVSLLLWGILYVGRRTTKLPLPPGPPRLPLIGNLHQLPTESPWRTFADWAKTYGPIYSLQPGMDTIIMLSSHAAARDLLDQRSAIYSSRPQLAMGNDVISKGNRTVLMPYGPKYRTWRRVQSSLLTPKLTSQYTALQDLESRQLMHELVGVEEDGWMGRFHRYASSLIYTIAFGKRIASGDETEAHEIGQIMENFLIAARVGTWIVDAIPILNVLPKALAPWKRLGERYHEYESTVYIRNLRNALDTEGWNLAKEAKAMKETQEMSEKELAYAVGIIYEAGSDTTTQALHSFVLSALAFPEEYSKAQTAVDQVLGASEYPMFEHRERLAYVEAVAKEVLRWRPVSAGGIPHAVTQDDEYLGYRIPRGATVIPNHWAIDRDVDVYGEDVETFRPSRWIENPDLPLASFGYGRRVCSGQRVAMNSLILIIARVLWGFDISHAVDADGSRIEVDDLAYTQGFNSGPMPFKARFVPRSEQRKELIESLWQSAEKDEQVLLSKIGTG